MRTKEFILILLLVFLITALFFNKFFVKGFVPIPGDLLVSEYNPWKNYSYLGYGAGGYPNKAQYFDVLRQLYPWKTFSLSQITSMQFPLWNPYNFSGSPLLANFQSAVFYPLNFIYLLLNQLTAWSVLVFLQSLLALLFTFFYARKIGISPLGSIFSSIAFSFSSFMTVWLEYNTIGHVILWFPLALLAVENLKERKSILWILIFIFSVASSLFAGHIQIFTYLLLFVTAYIFFRVKKEFLFFFPLILISLGIGAIQLLPGIELILNSARSPHNYDFIVNKILLQPWQFITLFVPDFFGNPATRNYWLKDTYVGDVVYIGLIPLVFAFAAIFKKKDFYVKFFFGSIIVLLIFLSLNPLTMFLYRFEVPFISGSAANLAVFLLLFSASLLSGFGFDYWRREGSIKKYFRLITPFIFIFILLWFMVMFLPKFYVSDWVSNLSLISKRNLIYSSGILIIGLIFLFLSLRTNKKMQQIFLVGLILITAFDLFRSFEKFNPFSPKELVFPNAPVFEFLRKKAGINRFWGYGSGAIEANFATQYNLFSPDGYDPLYPKQYGEFIQSSRDGKIHTEFTTQTRSDAVIAPGFGEKDLIENASRLKVLNFLGVKYIVDRGSSEKTFPADNFEPVFEDNGFTVYENLKALPRVFLASDYKVFKNKEEFSNLFFSKDLDPSKAVFLEEKIDADLKGQGEAKIKEYKPNEIIIDVQSGGNQFLFLSDTYYPGWKAFIGQDETKIYRANYAFRAILVPSGKNQVRFVYDPLSFKAGVMVTAFSLLTLLLFVLFVRNKYNKT